jgi:hypothetical protein
MKQGFLDLRYSMRYQAAHVCPPRCGLNDSPMTGTIASSRGARLLEGVLYPKMKVGAFITGELSRSISCTGGFLFHYIPLSNHHCFGRLLPSTPFNHSLLTPQPLAISNIACSLNSWGCSCLLFSQPPMRGNLNGKVS